MIKKRNGISNLKNHQNSQSFIYSLLLFIISSNLFVQTPLTWSQEREDGQDLVQGLDSQVQVLNKEKLKNLVKEKRKEYKKMPKRYRVQNKVTIPPFVLDNQYNFRKTNFDNLEMKDCIFSQATFGSYHFANDVAANPTFKNSNLSGCSFSQSLFRSHAIFDKSIMTKVDFSGVTVQTTPIRSKLSFKDATLTEANLSNVAVKYADFENAKLANANLSNFGGYSGTLTDGSHFNFIKAILPYANLEGLKGDQVNFTSADLRNTKFAQAHIKNANFNQAHLEGADLSESQITCVRCQFFYLDPNTKFSRSLMEDLLKKNPRIFFNKVLMDFKEYYEKHSLQNPKVKQRNHPEVEKDSVPPTIAQEQNISSEINQNYLYPLPIPTDRQGPEVFQYPYYATALNVEMSTPTAPPAPEELLKCIREQESNSDELKNNLNLENIIKLLREKLEVEMEKKLEAMKYDYDLKIQKLKNELAHFQRLSEEENREKSQHQNKNLQNELNSLVIPNNPIEEIPQGSVESPKVKSKVNKSSLIEAQ